MTFAHTHTRQEDTWQSPKALAYNLCPKLIGGAYKWTNEEDPEHVRGGGETKLKKATKFEFDTSLYSLT